MRKYLAYYENEWPANIEELTAIKNKPFVGYLKDDGVKYTIVPKLVVYDPYVTFTAQQDNSSIGLTKLSTKQTLEYSTDTTTWNTFDTTTNIPLNNGNKVYIRGILNADNTNRQYTQFKMTGKISASGNCNAIWNHQDLNASLKRYCGYYMFSGCTSLTTAPELPATTLEYKCYQYMFSGCTSLTVAPELPATTLTPLCYSNMFENCSSLTIAPKILPATELVASCYYQMFSKCTSLTIAPELPATTLANDCYKSMFYNCTSLTTASELPATTLSEGCYWCMFENCSSLTTAPELPATTLADKCYYAMFYNCTSLNRIKCLATDISATECTWIWVNSVASTGTFIKHPSMNSWSTGTSGIPRGWTVVDAEL